MIKGQMREREMNFFLTKHDNMTFSRCLPMCSLAEKRVGLDVVQLELHVTHSLPVSPQLLIWACLWDSDVLLCVMEKQS